MKRIKHYSLTPGMNFIEAPSDIRWLRTVTIGRDVFVYAAAEEHSPLVQHPMMIVPTGDIPPLDASMRYIDTFVVMEKGQLFVFHLYIKLKPSKLEEQDAN